MVESLCEEVVQLKGELERCKSQLAQGARIWEELTKLRAKVDAMRTQRAVGATVTTPKLDVLRPRAYEGARKAREIENFLYRLERYFKAL